MVRTGGGRVRLSGPRQVSVRLTIPFVGEVAGVWEPVDVERRAAWELYVELVTRVSVIELGPDEGTLRDALTSLYSLFGTTRQILKQAGPEVAPRRSGGQLSFGALAVAVLNGALRPVLSRWHPRLTSHEAARPADVDPVEWERTWERAAALRAELAATREVLAGLARILAEVANVAYLPETSDPR